MMKVTLVSVLTCLLLNACSISQSVTIKDIAEQNMAIEAPSIPHFQGVGLKAKETQIQGEYRYAGPNDPSLPISSKNHTEGHSNITHAVYGQIRHRIGDGDVGWEFGLYGGGALNMKDARVQNTTYQANDLEDTSTPYLKLGLGFRGPLVHQDRFSIGLNLEAEVVRQAYEVALYRVKVTETTIDYHEEVFRNYTPDNTVTTVESSEQFNFKDHLYSLTPRAGVYGNIMIIPQLHVILGVSAQLSQRAPGYGEKDCEYKTTAEREVITLGALEQCAPEDSFPIRNYQTYLSYYTGLSAHLSPITINLIASRSSAIALDVHAPVPFQLHSSLGVHF